MSLLLAIAGAGTTTYEYVGSGGLAFSGSAELARTFTTTASGGLTLDGTAGLSITVVPLQSGGAAFGGSAATEFISAAASASTSTSTGGGWFSRTAGRLAWFAEKSKPRPLAKVFSYSPAGGISFGGSAPSSFTSVAPRRRREEEEAAALFAMLT